MSKSALACTKGQTIIRPFHTWGPSLYKTEKGLCTRKPCCDKGNICTAKGQQRLLSQTHIKNATGQPESDKSKGASTGSRSSQLAKRAQEKLMDKEFFLDLLSSAATRRDAKAYLSRLRAPREPAQQHKNVKESIDIAQRSAAGHGVNLGSFFGHGRAVEDRPVFSQYSDLDLDVDNGETIHLALVKITEPQHLDDVTISGIALTLSQLARLSMVPCVVVDTRSEAGLNPQEIRKTAVQQADRLSAALDQYPGIGARRADNFLTISHGSSTCRVLSRKLLLRPLREGRIPVIAPLAYTASSQQAVIVPAEDVILALTKEFAGLTLQPPSTDDPVKTAETFKALQKQVSVDRIIILDPNGGISNPESQSGLHVFINLEQEYDDILSDIDRSMSRETSSISPKNDSTLSSSETQSEPLNSQAAKDTPQSSTFSEGGSPTHRGSPRLASVDLQNLKLLKAVLSLLPPTSSAIVTAPDEAARSSRISEQTEQISGVSTRRQKNPLIHNLLTDKPAHSSSLPAGRLGLLDSSRHVMTVTSTFVKKGMSLTILPDPRISPWAGDNQGRSRVNLKDPSIDLPRLIHLIEDSFDRKLDAEDYLNRVNDRIAGLIIAGEYEGGALFTWEVPEGISDADHSPGSRQRLVPYLDKFAVLKRSQGAGGVADIVFNAMVGGCFPDGVCWRSRRDNPVNKWYFERARGTWKIPETNWTMFWTTPGVEMDSQLFRDYESVCRGVQPSWADKQKVAD